jgi:hypothetical protein
MEARPNGHQHQRPLAAGAAVTDRLIRITTALAVACVAAIISYEHAYELISTHGEHGLTARLLPFTVCGLIWAASMVDGVHVPRVGVGGTVLRHRCSPESCWM